MEEPIDLIGRTIERAAEGMPDALVFDPWDVLNVLQRYQEMSLSDLAAARDWLIGEIKDSIAIGEVVSADEEAARIWLRIAIRLQIRLAVCEELIEFICMDLARPPVPLNVRRLNISGYIRGRVVDDPATYDARTAAAALATAVRVQLDGRDAPKYARAMLAVYRRHEGRIDDFPALYEILSREAPEPSGALMDAATWENRQRTVRRALRRAGRTYDDGDLHGFMRAIAADTPDT